LEEIAMTKAVAILALQAVCSFLGSLAGDRVGAAEGEVVAADRL
jgi:hypothetical protein